MAGGSFFDRIAELRDMVGEGDAKATVEFDQVYAAVQHEGYWLTGPNAGRRITEHPGGGGGKYLQQPLLEGKDGFLQHIADRLLDDGVVPALIEDAEELADRSATAAPVEFGDLRESAHPTVTDDGATVYDRPPAVHRLSADELDAKARGRQRGDYRRTYLPKTHPLHGTLHAIHGGTHTHTSAPKPAPTTRE